MVALVEVVWHTLVNQVTQDLETYLAQHLLKVMTENQYLADKVQEDEPEEARPKMVVQMEEVTEETELKILLQGHLFFMLVVAEQQIVDLVDRVAADKVLVMHKLKQVNLDKLTLAVVVDHLEEEFIHLKQHNLNQELQVDQV